MKFSTLLASSPIHICIIYSISQFKFYYLFSFDFYFSPVTIILQININYTK